MLDWPLHSHTSPTWAPVKLTVALPDAMVIVLGTALADMAARVTCHLPSVAATVDTVWSWNCTVTVAPGSAVPNTGTGTPRCKTMFDPKIGDTVNAEVDATA